jgi:hypothetical protein
MHYVPIVGNDEYLIDGPSSVRIGSFAAAIQSTDWGLLLVDSGATRIYLPQPVYDGMQVAFENREATTRTATGTDIDHSELWSSQSGCMEVDCSLDLDSVFATIEFDFRGQPESPPTTLVTFTVSLQPGHYLRWISPTTLCLNIRPSAPINGISADGILGEAFLHAFYAVFDKAGHRIGLAPKTNCGSGIAGQGCTELAASNYDLQALADDGSCVFSGCDTVQLSGVGDSCTSTIDGTYIIDEGMPTIDGRPHYVGMGTNGAAHAGIHMWVEHGTYVSHLSVYCVATVTV